MFMDNSSVKFQGFHPSEFTQRYIDEIVSELHEEAPYGSTLKAVFTRKDHQIKAVVTIHSSAGRFFAVASGTRVRDVSHKIVEQIRKQLSKWKSKRFHEHESLRDIAYLGEDLTSQSNLDLNVANAR